VTRRSALRGSEDQREPTIASDDVGGAIVTWSDARNSSPSDIYAQRVDAAGNPQWTPDGAALCTAAGDQGYQTIIPDGVGAIVTYDTRNGIDSDIYAQR
jgi:hypothetical protein